MTGQQIQDDCAQLGLAARWIITSAPTRVCSTLVEAGRGLVTELVPEAPALATAEREGFQAAFAEEAAHAAVVVLIGSLPPGTSSSFYQDLLVHVRGRVILDARGPELLAALAARPFLVKPNRQELASTLGRPLETEDALFEAMRELNGRGAKWVVVSGGDAPVYASGPAGLWRLQAPAVRVVNPIGCGDCLAAGLAHALTNDWDIPDVLCFGLATAVDKLGRLLPGQVERDHVEELARSVTVDRL
jgi:tagatose 6-phosphate kinase